MDIVIGEKTLKYELKGTIGPAFVVEQMSGEPFNLFGVREKNDDGELIEVEKPNPKHSILFILVVLQFSNPEQKDELTLDWILANLTTPILNELMNYTVSRWAELEGWKTKDSDKVESVGSKNV